MRVKSSGGGGTFLFFDFDGLSIYHTRDQSCPLIKGVWILKMAWVLCVSQNDQEKQPAEVMIGIQLHYSAPRIFHVSHMCFTASELLFFQGSILSYVASLTRALLVGGGDGRI